SMMERVDPQRIALILDRAMYEHIFHVCRKNKDKFTLNYFILQTGLINVRTFLRVRKIDENFEFLKSLLLPNEKFGEEFFKGLMEHPLENIQGELASTEYDSILPGLEEFIKTGSLTRFERMMDDFLLDYVRDARWNPMGIEPIIGFLLAKENEIRIIRIIMVGKINNLPAHSIRERLRDVYV
ncbi:MAG TPA: V-type ATPase subunit, partial [Clostridia bacterium]|nr:V-type ATPase subunit [Clostridia bacterium]